MKRLNIPKVLFVLSMVVFAAPAGWADPYAYIPGYDNDLLVRIDTNNDDNSTTFDSVSLESEGNACGPQGVAVTPNGRYVLVTCGTGDALAVVSTSSFPSGSSAWYTGESGDDPRGVAVDPQGQYVYVANYGTSTVGVDSLSSPGSPTILDDDRINGPFGIAVIFDESASEDEDEDIRKIYVANRTGNTVTVITQVGEVGEDAFTYANVSSYPSASEPVGVTASPDGSYVYVANFAGDTVSVINTSTDAVEKNVSVGSDPWGVTVGAMGDYLYVTNSAGGTVTIIDTDGHTVAQTVAAGTTPYGIAAPKNGDFAYAVNNGGTIPVTKVWAADLSQTPESIQNSSSDAIESPFALGAFIGGTPPAAPTGFSATVDGADAIELTWTNSSSTALGFKIERRIQDRGDYSQIAIVDEDAESYNDQSVVGDTTYDYRIRAYTEAADSAWAVLSGDDGPTTEEGEEFNWCFIGTLLH